MNDELINKHDFNKNPAMIFTCKNKPDTLEINHVLKSSLAGNEKTCWMRKRMWVGGKKKHANQNCLNILNFSKGSVSQFIAKQFFLLSLAKLMRKSVQMRKRNVGLCKWYCLNINVWMPGLWPSGWLTAPLNQLFKSQIAKPTKVVLWVFLLCVQESKF